MKHFNRFTRLLISAIVCVSATLAFACAWDDLPDNVDTSVFTPEIIHQPDMQPFFLSYHYYYPLPDYQIPPTSPTLTERNTLEWRTYFKNQIDTANLAWLLYTSTESELHLIEVNLHRKTIATDTLNKAVVSFFNEQPLAVPVLQYLQLAKKAEPFFNVDFYSWDPVTYDRANISLLAAAFLQRYNKMSDKFLKQRYGFQYARALSVLNRHEECSAFVDSFFEQTRPAGSMFYRTLGYKARSFYHMENYGEANYWYSYLFSNDPCSRYTAFQSFHPQEETDWGATLGLARTNEEKERLWFLLGIYADPIRASKEIYTLNKNSNKLPLLLVRTVNLAEEEWLNNPVRNGFMGSPFSLSKAHDHYASFGYTSTSSDSTDYSPAIPFIEKVIAEKQRGDLNLWNLSAAYLHTLKQNYTKAKSFLDQAHVTNKDSLLMGQKAILKGIIAARTLVKLDASTEQQMFATINEINSYSQPALRKANAVRHILSCMSLVYSRQHQPIKSELSYPVGSSYYQTALATQQMIDFFHRASLSPLEKFMITNYPIQSAELHDIKATRLMYAHQFAAAAKEFEIGNDTASWQMYGNPFNIRIVDCHDCDFNLPQKVKYTKYSFCKKMLQLKQIADTSTNQEMKAQNYFLYANGLYNLTWYGNARASHETAVNIDSYNYMDEDGVSADSLTGDPLFNCDSALHYYQRAATCSNSKEFKARCTWMSAKCEHNKWLNTEKSENADFVAGMYFKRMKANFNDTRYYAEVIRECGYFCQYITGSSSCIRNRD